MSRTLLVALQALQVAILWTHDWVPLGRLNDVPAVRRADSHGRLVRVTLIQSLPYTISLIASADCLLSGRVWPHWLWNWLWVSYAVLFAGELTSWWVPYLLQPQHKRVQRYQAMFGSTHAFLPKHHGIVPNTLHSHPARRNRRNTADPWPISEQRVKPRRPEQTRQKFFASFFQKRRPCFLPSQRPIK